MLPVSLPFVASFDNGDDNAIGLVR